MTTPTPYTGAPVATSSESPDWPASLWAYANSLDDQHVLYATSQSNRDSLYANVRAGAVVSCAALGIVWQKTTTPPTAANWRIIAENGPLVTSGILTPAANFSIAFQYAQRKSGALWLRGRATYSGSTITPGTNGNITDTAICTLGSSYQPDPAFSSFNWTFRCSAGASSNSNMRYDPGSTSFYLETMYPGSTLNSGDNVNFDVNFPVA